MRRNVSLSEISDGKLYGPQDMVKAGCDDCRGCSACCQGMGDTVILDPCDVYRMTTGLGISLQELLNGRLSLSVVDGLILPHLSMEGKEEKCAFLSSEGRCSIHAYRPGICRLFPLGRIYENGSFRYFLQTGECVKKNRTKVKVSKWIDTPDQKRYDGFIIAWHYFLKELQEVLEQNEDETLSKNLNLYLLNRFFMTPYEAEDFYGQFERRLQQAREELLLSEG